MIKAKLIKINDRLEFKFKGHTFSAKIVEGGLIVECKYRSNMSNKYVSCLNNVIAFSSLTAWTEACLQDVLEEYYTRYSSWKRVVHIPTNLTLSELRDRCKLQHSKIDIESYKEIYRLNTLVNTLKDFIVKNGLKVPKLKNEFEVPLTPKRKIIKLNMKDKEAYERVQKKLINYIFKN